jgi:hypothetical protein
MGVDHEDARFRELAKRLGILNDEGEYDPAKVELVKQSWLEKT